MPTDVQKFSRGYQGKIPGGEAEHQGRLPQPGVPKGVRNRPTPVTPVTAATEPTVTIAPTGHVTTQHFGNRQAAQVAKAQAVQAKARVQRVRRVVDSLEAPKRELHVAADFLEKATRPKPIAVAAYTRKLPGSEAPKAKPVKVEAHQRKAPEIKGTPKERKAARVELKQAKAKLLRSRGSDGSVTGEIGSALEKRGYNKIGASGVIGNAVQESGLDPTAKEPGTDNGGLWGFTAEPNSLPDEQAFAAEHGRNWANPKVQTAFLTQHVSPETKAAVNAAKSPEEAAAIFQNDFEHPAPETENQARREQGAVEAYESGAFSQTNPKAFRNYKAAVAKAKSLGLKVGKPPGDIVSEPGSRTVKVKASGKGMAEWAEAAAGTKGGSPKAENWGAHFGLSTSTEPWCANFASNGLARRGFKTSELPANPNYVPSYEEWATAGKYATDIGTDISKAKPGDLIAYSGAHIAVYLGDGKTANGNGEGDEVNIAGVEGPAAVSMIIRPKYKGGFIKVAETAALPGTVDTTGSIPASSAAAVVSAVSSPGRTSTSPSKVKLPGLTAREQIERNERKLRKVGEAFEPGEEAASSKSASLHEQLAALERKYKVTV